MITDKHIELCERFAELLVRYAKRQSEEIDTLVNEYPDLPALSSAETRELLLHVLSSNFVTSLGREFAIPDDEVLGYVSMALNFFCGEQAQ